VLVTGQRNSGKSHLINALLGRQRAPVGITHSTANWPTYAAPPLGAGAGAELKSGAVLEAQTPGDDPWELMDSPPLSVEPSSAWLQQAREADLLLWVMAAHRADRAVDQRALKALRARLDADIRGCPLPVLLVLTHADRLEPVMDWQPPYDEHHEHHEHHGARPKERSMARARQAASRALAIPPERTVLVALGLAAGDWNLDTLRTQLRALWPEAEQKRLERLRRPEGALKAGVDLVRSTPGAVKRLRQFLRR
jgi:predicted GTPase